MSVSQWQKVLWKKQPFPDDHIPSESFLSALRKNPNFKSYTYGSLVLACCSITQHLATIFTFLGIFVRINDGLLDPRGLVWASVTCFIAGYLAWELLDYSRPGSEHRQTIRIKTLKSSILIFFALMSLSPVLKTLTAATSSDSIWAISAILFILHALLANSGSIAVGGQVRERLTSVLSMNAAISSSVVLASRLSSDLAVFALILCSVQLFALFPVLRHRLQTASALPQAILTISMSVFSVSLTASISATVAFIYSATLVFVQFLAPAILVWAQRYKNEIRGPWDVAVPKVN